MSDTKDRFGATLLRQIEERDGIIAELRAERDKLQAFKDWVHAYLDGKGVPKEIADAHLAAGCRIGGRMDWVFAGRAGLATALKRAIQMLETAMRKDLPGWKKSDISEFLSTNPDLEMMRTVLAEYGVAMPEPKGYAVWSCEQIKDGKEESARLFNDLEDAMRFINTYTPWKGNTTFRLFELGKEIPLEQVEVEKPQPPIVAKEYRVAKEAKH